jgi:hypothetical protein
MDASEIDVSFHEPWPVVMAYIDSLVPHKRDDAGFLSLAAVYSLLESLTDNMFFVHDFRFNIFHNVCVVAELTQEYNFIKIVEGRVMLFRYGRGMAERDEGPRFAEFTATGQLVE